MARFKKSVSVDRDALPVGGCLYFGLFWFAALVLLLVVGILLWGRLSGTAGGSP
jgi:hypothetical protein